jgi:hypothetical protein
MFSLASLVPYATVDDHHLQILLTIDASLPPMTARLVSDYVNYYVVNALVYYVACAECGVCVVWRLYDWGHDVNAARLMEHHLLKHRHSVE